MSDAYPLVPLGDVLDKSTEQIALEPTEQYKQVTVRLWGKGVTLRDEVTGAEIAAERRYVVRAGQFILSRIDARNGAFGIVPNALDGAVVSTDFPVFNVNVNRMDSAFLGWMSKTAAFVDLCKAASEGTTNRVRLKEDKFLAMRIPLPTLAEQRRIVARIEALAARIAEARGLRRQAMEEVETLMDAELDRIFREIDERISPTFIGQSGGFVTSGPRGWGDYYSEHGDRRLIRVENVWNRELNLSDASRVSVPPHAGDLQRSQVKIGDVLVTITGAIGRVGVVRQFDLPCHVSQHVALVRPPTSIASDYLYWYLRSPSLGRSQTEGNTYGATKPGINLTTLRMLRIAAPIINEQQRISDYLDSVQAKVDAVRRLQTETAAELDALLPAVLHRAFRGELA